MCVIFLFVHLADVRKPSVSSSKSILPPKHPAPKRVVNEEKEQTDSVTETAPPSIISPASSEMSSGKEQTAGRFSGDESIPTPPQPTQQPTTKRRKLLDFERVELKSDMIRPWRTKKRRIGSFYRVGPSARRHSATTKTTTTGTKTTTTTTTMTAETDPGWFGQKRFKILIKKSEKKQKA